MLRRLEQGTARSDDASSSVSTRTWTASQPAATPLAVRRLPGPSTPAGLPKTVPARSGFRGGQLLGKAVKLLLIGTVAAVAAVVVTQVAFLSRKAVPMHSGHSFADRDAAFAIAGLMCVSANPATGSLVRCVRQPVWTGGSLQCLQWHQDAGCGLIHLSVVLLGPDFSGCDHPAPVPPLLHTCLLLDRAWSGTPLRSSSYGAGRAARTEGCNANAAASSARKSRSSGACARQRKGNRSSYAGSSCRMQHWLRCAQKPRG